MESDSRVRSFCDEYPLLFAGADGTTLSFIPYNAPHNRGLIVEFRREGSTVDFKTRVLLTREEFYRLNLWMVGRYRSDFLDRKDLEELEGFLNGPDEEAGV